jgi:hypothetical protein
LARFDGSRDRASMMFQPCFLAVETKERISAKSIAPCNDRKPPEIGEPRGAGVDAALALDELIERIGIRFVDCRVSHEARPFAPSTLVGFGRVGGAPDDRGERVFPIRYLQPL